MSWLVKMNFVDEQNLFIFSSSPKYRSLNLTKGKLIVLLFFVNRITSDYLSGSRNQLSVTAGDVTRFTVGKRYSTTLFNTLKVNDCGALINRWIDGRTDGWIG